MKKIEDEELREYQLKIGQKEYRKIQMNYCNKSARIRNYNLRVSRQQYENSEEKLERIKEKYKNGVTMDSLKKFIQFLK